MAINKPEHIFIFFQKAPDNLIDKKISGEFTGGNIKGEFTKGKKGKSGNNIDGYFKGKIDGNFNGTIGSGISSNKTNKIDDETDTFVDTVNYNTSIARAVHHHINLKSDGKVKFSKVINFCDKRAEPSNKDTYEILDELVYDKSCIKEINYEYKDFDDYTKLLDNNIDVFDFNDGSIVHIATNGGPRDIMLFLSTFTKMLSHKNIESFLYYEDNQGVIKRKGMLGQNSIGYYDLLRAVDMFIETGNPNKLIAVYKDVESLDNFRKYIKCFNDRIQVCRKVRKKTISDDKHDENEIEKLDLLGVYRLLMQEIDNLLDKNNKSNIPFMLRLLLPEIKKAFENQEWNTFECIHKEIGLLNIIKWCHDNNLITIGYFIFKEELADFIFDSKTILKVKKDIRLSDLPDYKGESDIEYKKFNNYDDAQKLESLIKRFGYYIDKEYREYYDNNKDKQKQFGYMKIEWPLVDEQKFFLEKFGFECTEVSQNITFKIILLSNLVRIIRNRLAHSDVNLIADECMPLRIILDEYNERFLKDKSNNESWLSGIDIKELYDYDDNTPWVCRDISPISEKFYQVCYVILKYAYEDMFDYYINSRKEIK